MTFDLDLIFVLMEAFQLDTPCSRNIDLTYSKCCEGKSISLWRGVLSQFLRAKTDGF